jgi:hypothetical protein
MLNTLIAEVSERVRLKAVLLEVQSYRDYHTCRGQGCPVVSYRELLERRLRQKGRKRLYCSVANELKVLGEATRQGGVTFVTETEFLFANLQLGFHGNDSAESATEAYMAGLFGLAHLRTAVIFCYLSSLSAFDLSRWTQGHRYFKLGGGFTNG